jgi:hypothetical protein
LNAWLTINTVPLAGREDKRAPRDGLQQHHRANPQVALKKTR